jgi:hypothetical protein
MIITMVASTASAREATVDAISAATCYTGKEIAPRIKAREKAKAEKALQVKEDRKVVASFVKVLIIKANVMTPELRVKEKGSMVARIMEEKEHMVEKAKEADG